MDHDDPPFFDDMHKAMYVYNMARRRRGSRSSVKPETLDRMWRDVLTQATLLSNQDPWLWKARKRQRRQEIADLLKVVS